MNEEYLEEQPQWQPSGDGYPPSRPLRPPVVPEQWAEKFRPLDYPPPGDHVAPGHAPGSPPPGFPPPGFQPPGLPPQGLQLPGVPPQGLQAPGVPPQGLQAPGVPPQGLLLPSVPPQGYPSRPGFPASPGHRPAYGYAPPGYPPALPPSPGSRVAYGYPPPGSPRPDYTARHVSPTPERRRLGKRNAVVLAVAGASAIALMSAALISDGKPAKAPAPSSTPSGRASSAIALAEAACAKRPPASGDIYVRTVTSGAAAQARTLSGNWGWEHAAGKCLSAVQLVIATAPQRAGQCTQVGYAADNPGYDVTAAAAPRLTHITAQAGPACASAAPSATERPATERPATAPAIAARQVTPTAALSTAHPTRPAAAPSTPAAATSATVSPSSSAAPAGCHPLSHEGTCYEVGDYCRPGDAGVPGVAGDGEAITCADVDGWRWVPA